MRRAEQPGRFADTAAITAEIGEALEDVGNPRARPDVGAAHEGVVEVAFGLFGLTLCERDAGTGGQCQHVPPARRRGDRVVGPVSGADQITACQRDLRHALHVYRPQPRHTGELHYRLARVARGENIAGGDCRGRRRRAGGALLQS